jgi:hypothetical protein
VSEFLWKRIERKLAALPEERVYQVLDYVEFLESRYAAREPATASPLQKLAEKVEDTLRAGRVPVSAIRSTMDAMSAAGRLMGGIAAAGRAVVDEVSGAAGLGGKPAEPPAAERKPETPPPTPSGPGGAA